MPKKVAGRNGGTLTAQQPGDKSLNPDGRPRKLPELKDLVDDLFGGEDGDTKGAAIRKVLEEQYKKAERGDSRAAEIILGYAFGKPKQITEHTGKDGGPIETKTLVIEIHSDGDDG